MSKRRPAVADVLEELSDEEIRRRIVLHGGPNLPITEHTRGQMLEVLREYLEHSQHKVVSNRSVYDEAKSSSAAQENDNLDEETSPEVPSQLVDSVFRNDNRHLMFLFAFVSLAVGVVLSYILK